MMSISVLKLIDKLSRGKNVPKKVVMFTSISVNAFVTTRFYKKNAYTTTYAKYGLTETAERGTTVSRLQNFTPDIYSSINLLTLCITSDLIHYTDA